MNKKELNELKNDIADYQAFTKEAVKSVFDKLSEMEDFKGKTVIHQVSLKKEVGELQRDQKQIREDSMLAKTDALEPLIRVGKLSNLMH